MKQQIVDLVGRGYGLNEIASKLHCPQSFLLQALADAVDKQQIAPGRLRLLEDGTHCLKTVMGIMDSGGRTQDVADALRVTPKTARQFIVEARQNGWQPSAPMPSNKKCADEL